MTAATERIPVLVTRQEKESITRMARDAGLSVGEYLRRAAAAFRPEEDEQVLLGMIDQVVKTTARASAAVDQALDFVEASNQRMAALEDQLAREA